MKKNNEELKSIDIEAGLKKEKRKKNHFLEILRFIVTGVICTLIDAGLFYVLMKFVFNGLAEKGATDGYSGYVAWGIATTISFLVSCIVNFFISRLWVYQNVDKSINTKSAKSFWTYVGLSALGWLIGLGIQEAGVFTCNTIWPDINLSIDFVKVSWSDLWNQAGLAFWAFVVIFVIKTCVTLVYNYLTRKFIIFKEPKKKKEEFGKVNSAENLVITISEPQTQKGNSNGKENNANSKEKKTNVVTKSSFQQIFKEELEKTYGPQQKRVNESDAIKIVREEIEHYNSTHGRRKGSK